MGDYRDLGLDGRHWRAQFGGASNPNAPKIGAYVCCDATFYPGFRLILAGLTITVLAMRVGEFDTWEADIGATAIEFLLYFEHWVLILAVLYYSLAASLTLFATLTVGAESTRAPLLVWLTWAAYGALLPAALLNALVFPFVMPYNFQFLPDGELASQIK